MAKSYRRKVQGIIDGDTFWIQKPIKGFQKVRLAGVGAPERGKPYGEKAMHRLRGMIGGKVVTIKPVGTSYDRVVAEVYSGRRSVNKRMKNRIYK